MNKTYLLALFLILITSIPVFGQTQDELWKAWNHAETSKDWVKGEAAARQGMKLFPEVKEFPPCLVWSLRQLKRPQEALAIIEPLLRQTPQEKTYQEACAYTYLDLGWAAYEKGQRDQALGPFTKAWEILPEDQYVANAWGSILRDTGKLDQSLEVLEKAQDQWPENPYLKPNLHYALVLKATALSEAGDPRADGMFLKAKKLDSTSESYLGAYGSHLIKVKKYPEALKTFEECLKRYPANTWVKSNIEYVLQETYRAQASTEDLPGALKSARSAAERFPGEIWLLQDIFDYSFKLGDWAGADKVLRSMIAADKLLDYGKVYEKSAFPEQFQFKLQSLVWKYAEKKDFKKGMDLIDLMAKAFPGAWWVTDQRGVLSFHSGKIPQGITLVNQAYDLYIKDHPEHKRTLKLPLPLKGTYWVGGNNRDDSVTHAGLSRFCYDFTGADQEGNIRKPGSKVPGRNEDYLGFGAGVFAVASGEVIEVAGDFPDIEPRLTTVLGDGNYISVKGSDGLIYHYVHLRKGSVKWRKGQSVKLGDQLGELGNSGYTAMPHLHFGVYSPDWMVTYQVEFLDYQVFTQEGEWKKIPSGVPQTGDIIKSTP